MIDQARTSLAFTLLFACLSSVHAQEAPSVGAVAAKQFYKAGMEAAREGKFGKAATRFLQAIKSDETRPEYRAALSAVYLEQSLTRKAWKQIRLAMKRGAGDPRIASQLFAVWNAFGEDGLFQAGTVQSSVRMALGEPDKVNQAGANERWFYHYMGIDWADGLLYATIDLRGAIPSNLRPAAQLRLDPSSRWRVKYRVSDRSQNTTHYYDPKKKDHTGETLKPAEGANEFADEELFVIQRIFQLAEQGVSPRKWMEKLQRAARRANPDITWEVIEETDDRLIYEWRQAKAADWPARHELAIVMPDGRDLHYAAYSVGVEQLDTTARDEWIKIFQESKLHRYAKISEAIPEKSLTPTRD